MASSSSLNFLSLTPPPQTLSIQHSQQYTHSFATLPRLAISFPSLSTNYTVQQQQQHVAHVKFVRNVAVSSDLEVEDDEVQGNFDFSGDVSEVEEEPNFSPDLKLFVGNLPFSVDSAALAGLFESAGNVEMVEVIYDKNTGRSRGFGFVTMSTTEEVEAAVQQLNGYELQGRAIRVSSGPPPARENSSFRAPRGGGGGGGGSSFDNGNRVYVGNLAWGVDNLALESLFREHGNVKDARVVYDRESGRSRGFGFVTYSSAREVSNAIESLDGADLNGRSIRVSAAEARPRRDY